MITLNVNGSYIPVKKAEVVSDQRAFNFVKQKFSGKNKSQEEL